MHCQIETDVTTFAAAALPWLLREPIRHNVLSTVVSSWADHASAQDQSPTAAWCTVIGTDGGIVGVATVTPHHGVGLSAMPAGAARLVAARLAERGLLAPRANGLIGVVDEFRDEYIQCTGLVAQSAIATRMFQLIEVVPTAGVAGHIRTANSSERDLLVEWSRAFTAEAMPGHSGSDPAPPVDAALRGTRLLWVWEVAGRPVATARLSQPAAGVSRISGVYTPPEHRGRGYGSAVVAGASQAALDDGCHSCMLYTDLANPVTNKIYPRIGYTPVGDSRIWFFEPPSTECAAGGPS